mmetsp:Transcript_16095/g.33687  ORF Transcript_16095/g.33687 Transcript_16095/m.33687 type:complete len:207 (+) Transcript_16095:1367-1987(+)
MIIRLIPSGLDSVPKQHRTGNRPNTTWNGTEPRRLTPDVSFHIRDQTIEILRKGGTDIDHFHTLLQPLGINATRISRTSNQNVGLSNQFLENIVFDVTMNDRDGSTLPAEHIRHGRPDNWTSPHDNCVFSSRINAILFHEFHRRRRSDGRVGILLSQFSLSDVMNSIDIFLDGHGIEYASAIDVGRKRPHDLNSVDFVSNFVDFAQ